MSRLYEMQVEITKFDKAKEDEVKEAAEQEWPDFAGWDAFEDQISTRAQGNLCGGETEAEFAKRLCLAIFAANGKPCKVDVRATYLEELPYEAFSFDENHLPS